MKLKESLKFRKMIRLFSKGLMICEGCGTKLNITQLTPLRIVPCEVCKYGNFIPYCVADFWLFKPLGGGGMGSVYGAYSTERHMFCAIKVLHRDKLDDPDAIAAHQKEIRFLTTIGPHPGIVPLIAYDCIDGEYFYAMEFIEGQRLDEQIAARGSIPELEVVNFILALLDIEKYIFQCGFLYRDIKPENILIRENGYPVLCDFGLCQLIEDAASYVHDDLIDGSAHYMPPERLLGHPEGPYSEMYSLGMLMYEMLTGEKCLKSSTSQDDLTMKHVVGLRLKISTSLKSYCNPKLAEIIEKMVQRNPQDRFQTFEDVEAAIAAVYTF